MSTHTGSYRDGAKLRKSITSKPKAKTGCLTCRVRKVKCDEGKPACHRCISTGRVCDGYQSVFRPLLHDFNTTIISNAAVSQQRQTLRQFRGVTFTMREIVELSHGLSTKPPAGGGIGFEAEAMAILHASTLLTLVSDALTCMRNLRSLLMTHGDISRLRSHDLAGFRNSIKQYNRAVGGLARQLSGNKRNSLEPALYCCQLFISIDIMQRHFVSSIQHFMYGLRIMKAYHIRPELDDAGKLVLPKYHGLPAVDIFVIKLFTASSCPYPVRMVRDLVPGQSGADHTANDQSRNELTLIKCQNKLTSIATETVDLLGKISAIRSTNETFILLAEKHRLLSTLDACTGEIITQEDSSTLPPLMARFQLLFYSVLRVVLRSALRCTYPVGSLEDDYNQMIFIAETLIDP